MDLKEFDVWLRDVQGKPRWLSSPPRERSDSEVEAHGTYRNHRFSELYSRVPYNPIDDREVADASLYIEHGRFYTEDDYPDLEVFRTAANLVRRFMPDYLLVHPMGMDYYGEKYGSDFREYRNHALQQDIWLEPFLNEWRTLGYHILVTADHGMNWGWRGWRHDARDARCSIVFDQAKR